MILNHDNMPTCLLCLLPTSATRYKSLLQQVLSIRFYPPNQSLCAFPPGEKPHKYKIGLHSKTMRVIIQTIRARTTPTPHPSDGWRSASALGGCPSVRPNYASTKPTQKPRLPKSWIHNREALVWVWKCTNSTTIHNYSTYTIRQPLETTVARVS